MKPITLLPAVIAACLTLSSAIAQSSLEATHNELRALRDGLLEAVNKGDIERQLTYLHTNVVITWHNAEVSRGRDGVLAYYKRLTSGAQKMVEKFAAEINVDELTILYGADTGISFGSSVEHFTLAKGKKLDLQGRWTATLVKEDGKWLIASLHVSSNLFDNAVFDIVKKTAFRTFCVVFVVAGAVGGLVGWLIGRKRRTAA
jgi:ketosteroid isomerase-like protein